LVARLAVVDALAGGGAEGEQFGVGEVVVDHDGSGLEGVLAGDGEEAGVARAGANEVDGREGVGHGFAFAVRIFGREHFRGFGKVRQTSGARTLLADLGGGWGSG